MTRRAAWVIREIAAGSPEAERVYQFWYRQYVEGQGLFGATADHQARRLTDASDRSARLFCATVDDEVVGSLRLNWGADGPFCAETMADFALDAFLAEVTPADIGVFSRFIVDAPYRAKGLPAALLQTAAQFVAAQGLELLIGDCELHLVNLYASLGLRTYGHLLNHPTSGLLVPLVLVRSDVAWLEKVRSPLTPILTQRPPRPAVVEAMRPLVGDAHPVVLTEALVGAEAFLATVSEVLDAHHDHAYPLFAGLDDDELSRLLRRAHLVNTRPGDALILAGHVSRTLYVVLGGRVEVKVDTRTIASAGAGEAVGEVAFFLESPRTADVIAGPDGARVLALNNHAVNELIEQDASVAARLLLNLTRSLCGKVGASARLLGG